MLKRVLAAAVLTLTVAPALASDAGLDARNALPLPAVTGPTKPGERIPVQAPPSEGVASDQRMPQDKKSERMACACRGGEKEERNAPAR
jgi:hypothetical protein